MITKYKYINNASQTKNFTISESAFSHTAAVFCLWPQLTPHPQTLRHTEPARYASGKRKMDLRHSSRLHALKLVSEYTLNCVYQEVFSFQDSFFIN